MDHSAAVAIALIGVLGTGAQWIAWRFHIPAIVILTLAGLLAGPAFGVLDPSEAFGELLDPFVGLAVAVILFEGGLRLRRPDSDAVPGIWRLCTIGLVLAFVFGTAAGIYVGQLSRPTAMVLGAILVVTGPTVITPLLRQAKLQQRTANLFLWEGIINDPLGALLAVVVFEFYAGLEHGSTTSTVVSSLLFGLGSGAGIGVLIGWAIGASFGRGSVPEFLKSPMLLMAVVFVYTAANQVHEEAGLLAVTVMGAVIGNMGLASISELTRFKEAITVTLVSGVFIVLSADMDVSRILQLDPRLIGLLFAFLFLVRPASVFLATIGAGMPLADRLLLGWIAPRGIVAAAVAGVFGPRLVEFGYQDAELLVPFVFSFVVLTVVLHGFSLGRLARALGVGGGGREGLLIVGASQWTTEFARTLGELEVPVVLTDTVWNRLRPARLANVPVHFGEVLAEDAEQVLPLHTLATVLAATENDAYNSLVCVHFGPELGRAHVFQVASLAVVENEDRNVQRPLRGRLLHSSDADTYRLNRRLTDGWVFHATNITKEYGFEDWQRDAADDAMPIAVVKKNGGFALQSAKLPVKPEDGDVLVSFTPKNELRAASS